MIMNSLFGCSDLVVFSCQNTDLKHIGICSHSMYKANIFCRTFLSYVILKYNTYPIRISAIQISNDSVQPNWEFLESG